MSAGRQDDARPLEPGRPVPGPAGVPWSERYGDVYHSADGALEQARHVFLRGNGLPERWRDGGAFTIVETGFGLGLNFLATWAAFRAHAPATARLNYVSLEKHPLAAGDLAALLARWPELEALARPLLAVWPPLMPGLHRLHFEAERIALTLVFGDAQRLLPRLAARADAFYLDGFAPERNPELWSDAVFAQLARLAAPAATLATWTVAGAVRQGLAAAGFAAEKRPGYGRKREMLAGRFEGHAAARTAPAERRAVVIGAGMAGACCAERLAARGWQVAVVERHPGPAHEASGNPSGVLLPLINLTDTPGARLSRACLLYAGRRFDALAAADPAIVWRRSGVLQLAKDERDQARHLEIFERLGLGADFARSVSVEEAAALAQNPVGGAGWWFPLGGWVAPARLCATALGRHAGVSVHLSRAAVRLAREAGLWRVLGDDGVEIASAPTLILANAAQARGFAAGLALAAVRGQVSRVPEQPARRLPIPVCRRGYITPALAGWHCVGATFDHAIEDAAARSEDHAANLDKLEAMLPGWSAGLDAARLPGRVSFRATTADRVPLLGAVPGEPGLYAATGLGARGLVWAPLLAELLASQLEGDPAPVESGLAAAVDPARFARWAAPGAR